MEMEEEEERAEKIVCIGDIHGQLNKLQLLWQNIEKELKNYFENTTIIFLGDLVDRGPNTKETLDWIINLKNIHKKQKYFYLAGNHDFAFAAFLGVLPNGSEENLRATWEKVNLNEIRSGEEKTWWKGIGYENMHIQGRRWGGVFLKGKNNVDSLYHSKKTFESYGVEFKENVERDFLLSAVPQSHKQFLRDMQWVFDGKLANGQRVIAVHAGLRFDQPFEDQISMLKERNCSISRVSQLCDRDVVRLMPPELKDQENIILVSGHFFEILEDQNRFIIDSCGGFDHTKLSCLILPDRSIISSDD